MKSPSRFAAICILAVVFLFAGSIVTSAAIIYSGNGNTSFNRAVGNGSLTLNDDGTTISGTFTRGTSGNFDNPLVIYIDSKSGGFTTTSGFNDQNDNSREVVSGVTGSGRATTTFASGFTADYAIALNAKSGNSYGNLFQLNNGGNLSLSFIKTVSLSPQNNTGNASYTFNFDWSDIGLTANTSGNSFNIESSLISESAFRSLESFESISGTAGWNFTTFGSYDTYVTPVPEPTNIALIIFGGLIITSFGVRQMIMRRARRCANISSR